MPLHFIYEEERTKHEIVLQVYAVDWSPNGEKAASGGKDRALRLWMG